MRTLQFSLLATTFVASLAAQTAETAYFQAIMSPANETPAVNIKASGLGTLVAHVVRDTSGKIISGSVDFWIDYNYPMPLTATGLHIHNGAAGVAGPVIINTGLTGGSPLTDPTGVGRTERQAQVLPTDSAGLATLTGMFQDPTQFYVNMHSTEFPGGFMRGQLLRAQVTHLMGVMTSANEFPAIPDSGNSAVSSVTAIGVADPATGNWISASVIFDVNYAVAAPVTFTGLHIHKGGTTVAGPIVIPTPLTASDNIMSDPSGKGNLHYAVNVNTLIASMQDAVNGVFNNPLGYYINVHTTVNPGGTARSITYPTDQLVIPVTLLPSNEVPAVNIAASGPGQLTINTARANDGTVAAGVVTFDVNCRFPGAANFIGFHIHNGAAGVNGPVIINTGLSGGNPVTTTTGFGNIMRTVTVGDAAGIATLNSIVSTPELQYVNLHTTDNPGGVIRAPLGVAPAGAPVVNAVISAVDDPTLTTVAPGELIGIFGSNFARNSGTLAGFTGPKLPTAFDGISATIGGTAAPVIFVATDSTVLQVPFEVTAGSQPVVVTSTGSASKPFNVTVASAAPAIFFDSVGAIVERNSDFSLIRPENPARANDILVIYATGLGQTSPPSTTGQLVSGITSKTGTVAVTIGGKAAGVIYSIASPGFTGLYQIAVTVPAGLTGTQKVQLTVNGAASNAVPLATN